VEYKLQPTNPRRIASAQVVLTATGLIESDGSGVAWCFDTRIPGDFGTLMEMSDLWVLLRGDFVVDTNGRAIDAEFVRAELPTGDRPSGDKHGVQGGLFESWFDPSPDATGDFNPGGGAFNPNRLVGTTRRQLTDAGVSRDTAARIEEELRARPFADEQDFIARVRPSDDDMTALRRLTTQRPEEG